MIKNTIASEKWERLNTKHIDQQFKNEIMQGMQCSPFEAEAILDAVYKVYKPYFETSGTLKPGQMLFQVVSIENIASKKLSECLMITVTLTIDKADEDLAIRQRLGVIGLRKHRLERICNEAYQQGGLLTVEDLANRIFNCGERTICRDIKDLRKDNIILPLRSTIQDMGRTISHRSLIIKYWLRGKEYSDIASSAYHSIKSVQNYVDKFKRTVALSKEGYDINTIAFLSKISANLAQEYLHLYTSFPMAEHRIDEINELFKKNFSSNQGGQFDSQI